jgi:nitrate reductase cytochrome c-type subunit
MKNRITGLKCLLIITVLVIALAGCAAIKKSEATNTEQLLAAAGFKMKMADTPEKLAHLQTLTQMKVVPHDRDGKMYWVYADANYCKCLYVGDQEAYQRYENLLVKQNIAEMNENAAMNWGLWGPWGW